MATPTPQERAQRLTSYVSALATETAYVTECAAEATELVTAYVGGSTVAEVKMERAILEVGADLYYRKQARSGSPSYEGAEMSSLQVPKDPMRLAYPLLRPDLPGFA